MQNTTNIGTTTNKTNVEFNPIGEIICKFKKYSPSYHLVSKLFFIESRAIYCNIYDSWQECFEDFKPDIILDCKKLGYTKKETEAVLWHVLCKFSHSNCKFKNIN